MKDLTGLKFGRLVVIDFSHRDERNYYWNCKCDCGNERKVRAQMLNSGRTQSCGCLRTERRIEKITKHNNSKKGDKTPEYIAWSEIKRRCYNQNFKQFPDYGGRGVIVCDRWKDSFENFLKDMGEKPTPDHSIDRIDVNGNYEPTNCRWADRISQQRNRRVRKESLTGHKGVNLIKRSGKYNVRISVNKELIIIGNFDTLEEAIEARKKAERKYWKSS
ncbi:TPA: AP2 domain-containing protein [Bacillus cereus]|uniref:AP2 domain-containing protein n=2 Tax=Bacillaceae TaxID=186817 RepID=UPI00077A6DBE|nr:MULTISPECIES: AP2 domain-containing protein [Bacillus]SDJ69943.1 hypothetical protein SAMN04488578_11977 [Bacillus sp. cl96]KXY95135.1 hypothetical protein AT279_21695 [Bacillus cereus]SEB14940.1 hypothetical protein SAMN04488575_12040 [Bacillus sp. cl115]SHK26092.1 hypothetical protein SAMN04488576_12186 [Bacillus sp. cl25]HDR8199935.1 AP2 domain-containing protein [Bacillus cereus]